MKRLLIFVICAITMLGLISCSNNSDQSKLINETDDISDLNVEYVGNMNSLQLDNIDELYDFADYVVLATPAESYKEAKQVWKNKNDEEVDDYLNAHPVYSCTRRRFKINKVLKGDHLKRKEIVLCEQAMSDGSELKICEGEYIAKKGNKYLLFLARTNEDVETYCTLPYQGKYDLDSDKNSENKHIDQKLFKQVKEKYKEEFKNK